jgi:pimeloyl-ACP methyl ester carboxylesterase
MNGEFADGKPGNKRKVWYKRVWVWIIVVIAAYLLIQGTRCGIAVGQSVERLARYEAETIALSYGNMTYIDRGEGETILSIHGIFGGYDQAFDNLKDQQSDYRIIAPSRFGYLGSDVSGDGTPAEQAAAYVELLDALGIEKIYLLGTSAGGTVAIRFALDYPERTKGLILFSSAMPYPEKPEEYIEYAGPPKALCNDYPMFLISPLFEPIMGMEPSTIYGMLPIGERKDGVVIDASITTPDMARNYDGYPIESLQVPTLILHAKDDKLASYAQMEKAVYRFPNCTFIPFETGGHMMVGHSEEIQRALSDFTAH